jgi:cytochrome c-type biogenesis protein CcmH
MMQAHPLLRLSTCFLPASGARSFLRHAVHATLLVCALMAAAASTAKEAALASDDPVMDAKVTRIAAELRCLVCQNQTIADSNADLAVDLRRQVREMLTRGDTERQILDYMTARYGDFVLYRPPLKASTAVLWFAPGVLLVVGVGTLVWVLRRRGRLSADRFEPDIDPYEDADDNDPTAARPVKPS